MGSVNKLNGQNVNQNIDGASSVEQQNKASGHNSEYKVEPILPGSLMWGHFGSLLFHTMLPQAFTMQAAYPMVDLAVGVDKKYKNDPYGRAKDSTRLLWPIVYSRPERAMEMGVNLKEMHRKIKGVNKDGKQYFALDPEAYSWVHVTGFDATLRSYELFAKPLNKEDRAKCFEEWQKMGRLLGVSERYIFETEEEYWKHFNYIIEEKLVAGEVLQELLDPNFLTLIPKHPSLKWLPDFIWNPLMKLAGRFQHIVVVATLPDNAKKKLNVKQSNLDKFLFKSFVWAFKHTYPLLPEKARYIPLAWNAIVDSRKHPEAYQWQAS